jgi:two-component system phosphate regulon sensor histidine kinase PhoR
MQSIISDLLALSRLDMENVTKSSEAVSIPHLLSAIVQEARALSGEHHVLKLESDTELLLKGDKDELYSAFSNLVFNAVQHTPARSQIRIQWYADEAGAHFTVTDNGPGIPGRHLPRLTERFYRVDKGRSRQSGGTGLGLAIVKHAITRHGGELRIASEVGKGSSFACHFPASRVAKRPSLEHLQSASG